MKKDPAREPRNIMQIRKISPWNIKPMNTLKQKEMSRASSKLVNNITVSIAIAGTGM
jgi:hypothetical protein